MEIDGKMRKTSETTESVGNNGKHRKQRKTSETSENVGKQQKMSETSELELVEIWYMTSHSFKPCIYLGHQLALLVYSGKLR